MTASRAASAVVTEPLIDAHAHFYHAGAGRADWAECNAARFRAGERIGVTYHVASCSAVTAFRRRPISRRRRRHRGNDVMLDICDNEPDRVRMFVTVNPNHTDHALAEIERCVARGAIGVKLLASRRADDPLIDPIAELAAEHGLPVLHHIWQHRRREWPSQEISDGADLARLAERHPRTNSSWRTSAVAATTCTRFPRSSIVQTSFRTFRAAVWIAGCSTRRSTRSARAAALGLRPHDVHRSRQAARAGGHRIGCRRHGSYSVGERGPNLSAE